MNCPVCGFFQLREDDVDHRHEWVRYYYYCPHCENSMSRKVTYKCQSSMVASDVWEDEQTFEDLRDEFENKEKIRGAMYKG
jgi:hypothetical protein